MNAMASIHSHPPSQSPTYDPVPASPTLTNPDMILPYSDGSSNIYSQSPPFSSFDVSTTPTKASFADDADVNLASKITFPTILTDAFSTADDLGGAYEHGKPLSDIGEEESIYRASRLGSGSATPVDARSVASFPDQTPSDASDDSTSTVSAASDLNRWKDFDSQPMPTTQETSEKPNDSYPGALTVPLADTRRSSFASLEDGDAESIALSERAERILANAKKRLSALEGNLTRARSSLLLSPSRVTTPIGEHQEAGGLYRSISQSGERKFATIGPGRPRQMQSNPQLSSNTHNRVFSETSIPPKSTYTRPGEVRSASAMEHSHSRSIDNMIQKSNRFPVVASAQKQQSSGSAYASSPLHPVKEDDIAPTEEKGSPRGLGILETSSSESLRNRSSKVVSPEGSSRSPSQASTRELREQVNDLKSRISNLRVQTKVDSLRRRSMQNLRQPSPFTAAEGWEDSQKQRPSSSQHHRPRSDENKLPLSQRPLSRQRAIANLHASLAEHTPQKAKAELLFETPHHMYEDEDVKSPNKPSPVVADSDYADAPEELLDEEDEPSAEEQIYLNEVLEESLREGDLPAETTATEKEPKPERHEDRADAFDYEHFILHSALGSYTRDGRDDRRDSSTSLGSVETTRRYESPTPTAVRSGDDDPSDETILAEQVTKKKHSPGKRPSLGHHRKSSVDSVSTMATFATATEGKGSDEGDESIPEDILNWGGNTYALQTRSRSATVTRNGALPTPPTMSPNEHGHGFSVHSLDEMTRLLMSFANPHKSSPGTYLALERLDIADRDLLERLLQSLGKLCSDTAQNISGESMNQYERKMWRRKLDAARMVLSGEVDIDPA